MSHSLDGDFAGTFPFAPGYVQSDSVRLHSISRKRWPFSVTTASCVTPLPSLVWR